MENNIGTLLDSWDTYPYKIKHIDKYYVSESKYKKVIKRFGEELAYELISTGEMVILPSRLGTMQITKFKRKEKVIDPKTTNDIYGEYNKDKPKDKKKFVYFTNRSTNEYSPKFFWGKLGKANFKNKTKWSFKMARPNIRPNTYNKNNPKISLVPFFKDKGWIIYKEYNTSFSSKEAKKKYHAKRN